ncbi:MAG: SCP2 sterol-binding domain-containing protein [Candidatus Odinarchaeota archaeon]
MLNSKGFSSVIHDLENYNEDFIAVFDKIIKFFVNIFKIAEELQEEIVDYEDLFQIIVSDLNFNFWLSISNGSIIYKKGINRNASLRIIFTKDILVKILKREISGTDAFMKGLIKADGDLSQGLRFIKLFRLFFKYLNNGYIKQKI